MKNATSKLLRICIIGLIGCIPFTSFGQTDDGRTLITAEKAKTYYKSFNMARVSVHDPSIVYDASRKMYYIMGSHVANASSSDLQNWSWMNTSWGVVNADGTIRTVNANDAFRTNQTKEITIDGETVAFGNFDAAAWNCALPDPKSGNAWSVHGNMWAPDIMYNPVMKKWCQYLSLNGPTWNSCIILLTADRIEGPYVYQGPVVYTGFINDTDERINFRKTDMELALGPLTSLPSRYNRGGAWGEFWPHAIDPCVFYDEEGKLRMAYGSWSGGIYILELDENTGLRDYNVKYASDYDSKQRNVTTDPYFGIKISGGHYVSGEAPYIEYIGNHYYLFVTNGGLEASKGYVMRVFRSKSPTGPFVDAAGVSAIFDRYVMNYGVNGDRRGVKLMGYYDDWGFMREGEVAQGHNSVLAAEDGNTYLVYHTRSNSGGEGHTVRVHQLFLNETGWLVAAPFEYNGEKANDETIRTTRTFTDEEIAGNYELMVHKYEIDHDNMEVVTPVSIRLNEDGSIEGAYTGTWSVGENNSYITISMGGIIYRGVVVEQTMEPQTIKSICFTACANNGVNIWGYKMRHDYALTYALNNSSLPVEEGKYINKHVDLYGDIYIDGITAKWESSHPEIISNTGIYNPTGLTENQEVQLTAELSSGKYYWSQTFNVIAKAEEPTDGAYLNGLKAYYSFDEDPYVNAYNVEEEIRLRKKLTNIKPTIEKDSARIGNVIHQYFGGNGEESYTIIDNPLKDTELDGFSISMWVKRGDNSAYDALWSFFQSASNTRLFLTGNTYIGFNNGSDWFDYNHPNEIISDDIAVRKWEFVTMTCSRENGITLYANGRRISNSSYAGSCNGTSVSKVSAFDYNIVVDFVESCSNFYLGFGSFWGSAEAYYDDIMIHNKALERSEILDLHSAAGRVTDFTVGEGGTDIKVPSAHDDSIEDNAIYDLTGRKVTHLKRGIYIRNGKKFFVE